MTGDPIALADVAQHVLGHPTTNGHHPDVEDSWEPRSLIRMNAAPPAKPSLVHGRDGALLYRGAPHLISGEPEANKSWVALLACAQVIRDGENVLWFDTDGAGPGDNLDRLKGLGLTDEQIDTQFGYVIPDENTTRERLTRISEKWRPAVVVIDALNPTMTLLNLDPMSETDVEKFRRIMLGCWGENTTELLLDHVAKDKEKRGGYSIGSQRKQALVRVHIQIEVVQRFTRETQGISRIYATKDRPGWHRRGAEGRIGDLTLDPATPESDIQYRLDLFRPDGSRGGLLHPRPTTLMETVSRRVEAYPGSTSNKVCEAIDSSRSAVLEALRLLVSEGYATVTQGKNNSHLHTIAKPYRKASDPFNAGD